jgi:hypothetical protein
MFIAFFEIVILAINNFLIKSGYSIRFCVALKWMKEKEENILLS